MPPQQPRPKTAREEDEEQGGGRGEESSGEGGGEEAPRFAGLLTIEGVPLDADAAAVRASCVCVLACLLACLLA